MDVMESSHRAQTIKPFLVMDIMERANTLAQKGMDIIHLEVGEPDFDTPGCVQDAAIRAMKQGRTHYTHSLGIPELRVAICDHYKKTYHVDVEEDQVLVTAGSSPALLTAIASLVDNSGRVMLTDPYYACYPNFIRIMGADPQFIPTGAPDGFQLNPDRVKDSMHIETKALIINSPANPTGICLDKAHMEGIASLGIPIISDEIYHGLVYESEQHSILEYTDNAIVINGFSKAYAMTGWRLGWAIFPKALIRTAQKIQQNLMICAPSIAQWAGISALTEAETEVEHMKQVFARRRKIMLEYLARHGFNVEVEPTGAFYVLANMEAVSKDSYSLAFDILTNTGVGVTPGVDFGPGAKSYIRFSYANSEQNIIQGIKMVADYINGL